MTCPNRRATLASAVLVWSLILANVSGLHQPVRADDGSDTPEAGAAVSDDGTDDPTPVDDDSSGPRSGSDSGSNSGPGSGGDDGPDTVAVIAFGDDGGADDDDGGSNSGPGSGSDDGSDADDSDSDSDSDDRDEDRVAAATAPIEDDDDDPTTDGFRAGHAIVHLLPGTDLAAFNLRQQTSIAAAIGDQNVYLLQLPDTRPEDASLIALEADPAVGWAELNHANQAPEGRPGYFFVSRAPTAEEVTDPYAPGLLGLGAARDCATRHGSGVIVAVLDTGIDASHPDLVGRVLSRGWNALTDSDEVADLGNATDDDGDGLIDEMSGHGTHVAGIVAQVAPGAMILPIKVLDSDGVGDAFFVAAGIYYALDHGARVINLSLGSTRDTRVIAEAVAVAEAAGVLVVAAAGNANRETPVEYPAADPGALGIAATDPADRKGEFSNYNAAVVLSAPGTAITSAFPGSSRATWSGTSMATPFVAGAAALLFADHPDWTTSEVRARLTTTAASLDTRNTPYAGKLGAGRLDVAAAVCGF